MGTTTATSIGLADAGQERIAWVFTATERVPCAACGRRVFVFTGIRRPTCRRCEPLTGFYRHH